MALESFLGVASTGRSLRERSRPICWRSVSDTFNASPSARLRSWLLPAILGVCFALAIYVCSPAGSSGPACLPPWGSGRRSPISCWSGSRQRTPLLRQGLRADVESTTIGMAHGRRGTGDFRRAAHDLETVLGLAGSGVSWRSGSRWPFHAAFDRQAEAERRDPVEQVEEMLGSLRLQGRDEDAAAAVRL